MLARRIPEAGTPALSVSRQVLPDPHSNSVQLPDLGKFAAVSELGSLTCKSGRPLAPASAPLARASGALALQAVNKRHPLHLKRGGAIEALVSRVQGFF